nr:MAG TPA: hypothetical protein [Caudoviricetes sp.]
MFVFIEWINYSIPFYTLKIPLNLRYFKRVVHA